MIVTNYQYIAYHISHINIPLKIVELEETSIIKIPSFETVRRIRKI